MINSLKRPPDQRSHKDVALIMRYANKNSFFSDLLEDDGPDALRLCCNYLTYQYAQKDELIFEQGI